MEKINDREYTIIIPKYDNSGNKIATKELKNITKEVSDHFGGATVTPSVLGCWKDEERNVLECEENAVITAIRDSENKSNVSSQNNIDRQFVSELSKRYGDRLGQALITNVRDIVEVDFVKGKYKEKLPKKITGIDFFEKLL